MDDGADPRESRRESSPEGEARRPEPRREPPAFASPPSRPALATPGVVLEAAAAFREPTAEILRIFRRVHVTLDIPGAIRDRIDVRATPSHLRVVAPCADGRVFMRELPFSDPVDPGGLVVTFRNGVLDVTLPRRRAPRDPEEG